MKTIKYCIMATLLFTVSHIYADKFTVNEFVINAGETKTISINLTNSKTIYGFQFSLYFPDEVTITARNSGALKISANQDRIYNWSIVSRYDENEKCYIIGAGGLDAIEDNSGTILSIEITASDMIDTRNKFVYIKKQKITINNANGDPVTIDADETTTETPCTLQIPVKIGSSGYCSFSWPRDLDFSDYNNNIFIAKDQNTNNVIILSVDDKLIPAGTGILIQGTPGEIVHPQTTTENVGQIDNNLFIGTSSAPFTVSSTGDAWALAVLGGKTGFYPCKEGVTVPQYKCYLPRGFSSKTFIMLKQVNSDDDLVSEDAGIVDGINTINDNASNDTYHDLQGRRVSTTRHGIYIRNNKKVIVK